MRWRIYSHTHYGWLVCKDLLHDSIYIRCKTNLCHHQLDGSCPGGEGVVGMECDGASVLFLDVGFTLSLWKFFKSYVKICACFCMWVCCCWVAQSRPAFCNPMDYSTPGFPVLHRFLAFAPTYVHWVNDAIQPPHPLLPSSPFAFSLSQHQGLFQWVSSLHQVAKVLELQHQSFQCYTLVNSNFI